MLLDTSGIARAAGTMGLIFMASAWMGGVKSAAAAAPPLQPAEFIGQARIVDGDTL